MSAMHLEELGRHFEADEIEWRIGRSGKKGDGVWATALAYVTNRAIQNRLDDVCGPENWKNEFAPWQTEGVLCGISIRIAGEWVTKWDGAPNTGIESIKGGLSDAMKRAGYQWGMGRYLYDFPETWVETSAQKQNGWNYAKNKDGAVFYWKAPDLPDWANPDHGMQPHEERGTDKGRAVASPTVKPAPVAANKREAKEFTKAFDTVLRAISKAGTIAELDNARKLIGAVQSWPDELMEEMAIAGKEKLKLLQSGRKPSDPY